MLAPVVTRRYAEALLDAAQSSKSVAAVEADLTTVAESLGDRAVVAFLLNPTIDPRDQRKRFVDAVAPRLTTPLVRNVLALLVDRRRAAVIPELPAAFRKLALDARGEAEGVLESSRPMTPDELRAVEERVSAAMSKKVHLTVRVAPELVGGLRVTVGSRRFDASVRGRLSNLRERLLAAPLPA
jgi:F-type H+-transporting ATPase subunit delta